MFLDRKILSRPGFARLSSELSVGNLFWFICFCINNSEFAKKKIIKKEMNIGWYFVSIKVPSSIWHSETVNISMEFLLFAIQDCWHSGSAYRDWTCPECSRWAHWLCPGTQQRTPRTWVCPTCWEERSVFHRSLGRIREILLCSELEIFIGWNISRN